MRNEMASVLMILVAVFGCAGCASYVPAPLEPEHSEIRGLLGESGATGVCIYDIKTAEYPSEVIERYADLQREIWVRSASEHPVSYGPVQPDWANQAARHLGVVVRHRPEVSDRFEGLPASIEGFALSREHGGVVQRAWIDVWAVATWTSRDVDSARRVLAADNHGRVVAVLRDREGHYGFVEMLEEAGEHELAAVVRRPGFELAVEAAFLGTLRAVGTIVALPFVAFVPLTYK